MLQNIFSQIDYYLLVPPVLISLVSVFVLSSFAPHLAQSQAVFLFIGIVLFFLLQKFTLRDVRSFSFSMYALILFLLVAVFFIGEVHRGSTRWLPIGGNLRFQPSEFAKPILILALSKVYSLHPHFSWRFFLLCSFFTGLYFFLVFLQPDLGTSVVFLCIFFVILYFSSIRFNSFVYLFLSLCLFLLFFGQPLWQSLHQYQRDRILTFLDPYHDPLGRGYNAIQAIITVGSGGFLGKGWGQGTQSHHRFLPEQYTDFAFATFSEEFGFVGVVTLIIMYLILLWRILYISDTTSSRFGFAVCICVAFLLFFQLFVNIGMNVGLMPITGITLPFFSYGGSSLISMFFALGFVHIVARYRG